MTTHLTEIPATGPSDGPSTGASTGPAAALRGLIGGRVPPRGPRLRRRPPASRSTSGPPPWRSPAPRARSPGGWLPSAACGSPPRAPVTTPVRWPPAASTTSCSSGCPR